MADCLGLLRYCLKTIIMIYHLITNSNDQKMFVLIQIVILVQYL